jgi:hypothetical protein
LGLPRWLAFFVPVIPLLSWLTYSLIAQHGFPDQDGGREVWAFVCLLLLFALPVSAITVYFVPKKNDRTFA